jgi:hypothetical protein
MKPGYRYLRGTGSSKSRNGREKCRRKGSYGIREITAIFFPPGC